MTTDLKWYQRPGVRQDVHNDSDMDTVANGNACASVAIYEHAMAMRGTYGYFRLPSSGQRVKLDADVDRMVAALIALPGDGFVAIDAHDASACRMVMVAWDDGAAIVDTSTNAGKPHVFSVKVFTSDVSRAKRVRDIAETWMEAYTPPVSEVADIHMLAASGGGYTLRKIGEEVHPIVRGNYSESVLRGYDKILREVLSPDPCGRIALLEGEPGTGKTRMVRSLVSDTRGRVVTVVVPSHMIADLSGPNLIGALIGQSRPVLLVLEDADFALLSRAHATEFDKQGNTSALSAVLNLSDGIIGSKINLRILATTNARIEYVDDAILRDGRLIARVHVGVLDTATAARIIAREAPAFMSADSTRSVAFEGMTLAQAYAAALRLREAQ